MRWHRFVLVGLLGLTISGCARASTAEPAAATPSALPRTSAPFSPASSPAAGLCAGDQEAARTVAVYRAMLTQSGSLPESLGKPPLLYVSSLWRNGDTLGPETPTGRLSEGVQHCLSAGVPGLPPMRLVAGPEDPQVVTTPTAGIRGFAGGAKFVTFGSVAWHGDTAVSYVDVDSGGGDDSGGKCQLRLKGQNVLTFKALQSWVS